MKNRFFGKTLGAIFSVALLLCCSSGHAENIDPDNDGFQFAWGENVGWINLEPGGDGGPGVEVWDGGLSGSMWGENVGWVNLEPLEGGVKNNGNGILSGLAWGENVGWINFAPETGGVMIDPATGLFSGLAWGENIGWINFAPNGKNVKTSWRADVDGDGVTADEDCDDSNTDIHPGAPEVCNSLDDDCDGNIDEGLTFDMDGDGYSTPGSCAGTKDDCNDNNGAIHPEAPEICDGIDNNCDGFVDEGLPVYIPAASLKAAIESALGKTDPTCADMFGLTVLTAESSGITELTGLQCAVNLKELSLVDNQITDLSPVRGLTNLTGLYLKNNQISDLTPLEGLLNLTTLTLGNNEITSVAALSNRVYASYYVTNSGK